MRGARQEVSGVLEAKLVEQLVDKTNEVPVDGKNGCTEAVGVGGQLSSRVKTSGQLV